MEVTESKMNDVIIVASATLAFMVILTLVSLLPFRKKVTEPKPPVRPAGYIDNWIGGNSEARKRHEERLASRGEHTL